MAGEDWSLAANKHSVATLERPGEPEGPLRLNLIELSAQSTGVRLVSRRMSLRSDQRYVLEFCGRATGRHEITVGARRPDPPTKNLGLYLRFALGPTWERFEVDFIPNGDDDSAEFFFEVAGTLGDIELSDITLRVVPVVEVGTSFSEQRPEVQEASGIKATPMTLTRPPAAA